MSSSGYPDDLHDLHHGLYPFKGRRRPTQVVRDLLSRRRRPLATVHPMPASGKPKP
jgi:hypothetical protein